MTTTPSPGSSVNSFVDKFAYDVRGILTRRLEGLKAELASEDAGTRTAAEDEAVALLDWLHPPLSNDVASEQNQIAEALIAAGIPSARRKTILASAARTTGRKPGRPRTVNVDAIEALSLHLKSDQTWRRIRYKLKGSCEHQCAKCGDVPRIADTRGGLTTRKTKLCTDCRLPVRSDEKKQSVCFRCVDALRSAVGELEAFMREHGIYPDLPRRVNLADLPPEKTTQ